jgi:hypothetical protein
VARVVPARGPARPALLVSYQQAALGPSPVSPAAAAGLTGRELVGWVPRGSRTLRSAGSMFIAPGTVRKHPDNAFAKL